MRFKSTLVLFAIFLALGAYVYFAEYRGRDARLQQEEAAKRVFQIDEKNVTEISLAYPDRTVSATKKGDRWEITDPPGLEADSEEWDRIASNIARVERQDTIATGTSDLSQYSLDKPSVRVNAKLTDGKSVGILFGGENPKKTVNYAKLADSPDVFLSPVSWRNLFQKTLTELRDKKVLSFDSESADALRITDAKGSEIAASKTGTDWLLKKPMETRADNIEIATFLSSLSSARASDFADPASDAKTTGLDAPELRITVHDVKAGADRVLLVGKLKEPDKYFAKDASRSAIFVIDKEVPEKARRPLFDWRDKSMVRLDRETIDEIEIIRGSEKISFKKQGTDWKLPDGRKLQWEKISSSLNTLEFEKAKQIVDVPKAPSAYGLDKPRLEVAFRQGAKETLRVMFGADNKDPEGVYLKTSANTAVMTVPKDVYDQLNMKAEDLVEPPAPPAVPPAPVTK